MYFHSARFSNYETWLSDPTHIGPSAQVVWLTMGQKNIDYMVMLAGVSEEYK
jgi:hypothetical protein